YHIGGSIPDRGDLLLQTPESLRRMLNLDVRVGHEALSIDRAVRTVAVRDTHTGRLYTEPYDTLVVCPGALPARPPLPGADHPRLFVLRTMDDMDRIKAGVDGGATRAVVIGGGYIGVELAEAFRARGLTV